VCRHIVRPSAWPLTFQNKISPALGNVYTYSDFFCSFCFRVTRQYVTDGRTDERARPALRPIRMIAQQTMDTVRKTEELFTLFVQSINQSINPFAHKAQDNVSANCMTELDGRGLSDSTNSRLWNRNIKTTTNIRTLTVKYTKMKRKLKRRHKPMQTN